MMIVSDLDSNIKYTDYFIFGKSSNGLRGLIGYQLGVRIAENVNANSSIGESNTLIRYRLLVQVQIGV